MSIFDWIDTSNLSILGCGSFNICYTDGNYAIKIGNTRPSEIDTLLRIGEHGLAVKVIAYEYDLSIPDTFTKLLNPKVLRCYNTANPFVSNNDYGNYIRRSTGCASVLITQLVKPCMRHDKRYSDTHVSNMYAKACALAERIRDLTGESLWLDVHPWNMGIDVQAKKLVVLDV